MMLAIVAILGGSFWWALYEHRAKKAGKATFWGSMQEAEAVARQAEAARRAQVMCPHCQKAGGVTWREVRRKKGISGGKATGALLTGGVSMLATGLSRKEGARAMSCSNCGMKWDVA